MDVLPDLQVGNFEVRDLLNLLMTALGAYLAWRAIQMGREQGEIAKRQAEIAETQHKIMQEQLAQKSDLKIALLGADVREGFNVYSFLAVNTGTKTVNGFHYTLSVSDQPFIHVLEGREGKEMSGEQFMDVNDWSKKSRHYTGFYQQPLFHAVPVTFATLIIDYTAVPADMDMHVEVCWVVVTEEGRIEGSLPDMFKDIKIEGAPSPLEMNGFHIQGSAKKQQAQP